MLAKKHNRQRQRSFCSRWLNNGFNWGLQKPVFHFVQVRFLSFIYSATITIRSKPLPDNPAGAIIVAGEREMRSFLLKYLQQICNNNHGGLLQPIAATAYKAEKNVVKSMVF